MTQSTFLGSAGVRRSRGGLGPAEDGFGFGQRQRRARRRGEVGEVALLGLGDGAPADDVREMGDDGDVCERLEEVFGGERPGAEWRLWRMTRGNAVIRSRYLQRGAFCNTPKKGISHAAFQTVEKELNHLEMGNSSRW